MKLIDKAVEIERSQNSQYTKDDIIHCLCPGDYGLNGEKYPFCKGKIISCWECWSKEINI